MPRSRPVYDKRSEWLLCSCFGLKRVVRSLARNNEPSHQHPAEEGPYIYVPSLVMEVRGNQRDDRHNRHKREGNDALQWH